MNETVRLTEFSEDSVPLSEEDVRFIVSELAPRIAVRREALSANYLLNPNQYVGVTMLPSGRRLEIRPKIPIESVFYMIAVALDLPTPFRDQIAHYERFEEVLEFVAAYFAEQVEKRIANGLFRAYVETEGNLPYLRGRIVFNEDIRQNAILRQRTYCRFSEFTWDIPENQILRQVTHLLGGWDFQRDTRLRLNRLDTTLAEVSSSTWPASIIDTFQYHRHNDDYRPLHRLSRLFLEGASVSEDIGAFSFRTFLVDMNKLFEEFVTQVLLERQPSNVKLMPQMPMPLDSEGKVSLRPDLVVQKANDVILVADCKYKRTSPDEFQNHDIYQALAYCEAAGIRESLLIYPLHSLSSRDEIRVLRSDMTVRRVTINLRGSLDELHEACNTLANDVFCAR
jgi:5-methylcytosine-specific restriction enzyme subunit McrC